MITPVDLQTVIVKGTDVSIIAAQMMNSISAARQVMQSEELQRAQQHMKMVNPENHIEGKNVKSSTEERGQSTYYFPSRKGNRKQFTKEKNKGSLLDVRL